MVVVHLTAVLRTLVGGTEKVEASGATLREIIADVERQHPALAGRIKDAAGIRPEVVLAVDGIEAFSVDQPVPEGAEVYILAAVAGGSGSR